jgi:two-component system, LytTR family, sensor kinase
MCSKTEQNTNPLDFCNFKTIMKRLVHIISPAFFGIVIYLLIRLVTDSHSLVNVWVERDWLTNGLELLGSTLIGYIFFAVLNKVHKKYDKKLSLHLNNKTLVQEIFELLAYIYITLNLTATVMAATTDNGLQLADFVVINTIPVLAILLLHTFYRSKFYLKEYVANAALLQEVKNDKLATELQFLKAQYHPHFLFNALNTVYFQMDESTAKAKETIEKLSDLLRYQLYEDQQVLVPIEKEVTFIKRYIALQKERLSTSAIIEEDFELIEGKIYPLLLMPLVENAFKYVSGKEKKVRVSTRLKKGAFCFEIRNSSEQIETQKEEGGIGLAHLHRRLELLYKKGANLTLKTENKQFVANLTLPL